MRLLLLTCILTSVYGCSPRVTIKEGELVGTTHKLSNDRKVYAFLGIPYAAPPIGDARFKEPKPPKPWKQSRSAKSEGNMCLQPQYRPGKRGNKIIGDEDCLYLNVFTPKIPENATVDELMNVLVYIHGGGFILGSGTNAYPDYILHDDNIVFVSFNYRLGVLGFFSVDHPSAPGNYGLKDQVEALRWVHRNIRYFGGDPNKVTIYGNSAGGASVHYHMFSSLNTGLFQSAISSSGSVSLPWTLSPNVVKNSKELVSKFNCSHNNVETTMKCLRTISAEEITAEGSPFKNGVNIEGIPYGPVIEPQHEGAFLFENPYFLLRKRKVKQVPFMTGVVETEGSVFGLEIIANNTNLNRLNNEWDEIAPKLFSYSNLRSKSKEYDISSAIRKHYFGNEDVSNQTINTLLQVLGDRYFYNGVIKTAKLQSSASSENIYCYKFYYRGTESVSDFYPNTNDRNYGVCHGDDMNYVLKSYYGNKKTKNDRDMAKLLCSSIIAFMKTGNPSTGNRRWEPIFRNDTMHCQVIYSYTHQRMEDIEDHNNTKFWEDLLPFENPEYDPR